MGRGSRSFPSQACRSSAGKGGRTMSRETWNVTFIGDYFSTVTTVEMDTEDFSPDVDPSDDEVVSQIAIDLATNMLQYHYGWDMEKLSTIAIEAEVG